VKHLDVDLYSPNYHENRREVPLIDSFVVEYSYYEGHKNKNNTLLATPA